MLKVEKISSGYNKTAILNDISFEIKEGEFVGIIGPNGSGKTTLARTITKVLPLLEGRILYKEADLAAMSLNDVAKKISFVPQEINTVFSLTVSELVMMGRFPHIGRFSQESKHDLNIVDESLKATDTLLLSSRDLDEISSGERQRALIAKALAQEPELLILDEPTSKLDIGHQVSIMDLLKKLNDEKGITILAILHDLNIASDYCDRLILLNNGRVVDIGAPREIIDYRIIEDIYKTTVVVKPSPVTGKPHVVLTPKKL